MIIRQGTGPLLSISIYVGGIFGLHFVAWHWLPKVSVNWSLLKYWIRHPGFRMVVYIERSPDRNRKVAQLET